MLKGNLLIIDDDQDFLDTMTYELEHPELKVFTCCSLQEVEDLIKTLEQLDYAIVDLRMNNESGLSIIPLIRTRYPNSRITMLTAFGSIATTVEAMKRGSDNYIMKPCSTKEIVMALSATSESSPGPSLEEFSVPDLYRKEREYIDYILRMKKGNISHAAQALGIKRQSLQRKLKKFIPRKE